jgi:hypothetical protein
MVDIIVDFKCRRCIMCQERFDLEIDCATCKYYWERVAKGEIVHDEEIEENIEED